MSRRIVTCLCDGCGRTGTCGEKTKAPKGWFYFELKDPESESGNTVLATLQACSEMCKSLSWKKRSK